MMIRRVVIRTERNVQVCLPIVAVVVMASTGLLSTGLLSACDTSSGSGMQIGNTSAQTELPRVEVKLPPPPSFNKEHPPASYQDGTLSVYGLRQELSGYLDKAVSVKGIVVDVYECPTCPKGAACRPCSRPHFWLGDSKDTPKDHALIVADLPEKPNRKKQREIVTGARLVVTGRFAKRSNTGFAASDGLLIYEDHKADRPE